MPLPDAPDDYKLSIYCNDDPKWGPPADAVPAAVLAVAYLLGVPSGETAMRPYVGRVQFGNADCEVHLDWSFDLFRGEAPNRRHYHVGVLDLAIRDPEILEFWAKDLQKRIAAMDAEPR